MFDLPPRLLFFLLIREKFIPCMWFIFTPICESAISPQFQDFYYSFSRKDFDNLEKNTWIAALIDTTAKIQSEKTTVLGVFWNEFAKKIP